jgi:glycosyltransferase involved in cell wall biosynthesis
MKILFVLTNLYPPQSYGGLRTSADQLCKGLQQRGHDVSVLCEIRRGGNFAIQALAKMKLNGLLRGHKVARDTVLGYPVWRTWFPVDEIGYVVGCEKPDLIVAMGGKVVETALAAKPTGLPILTQVHDVEFQDHGGDFNLIKDYPCVTNSKFTAEAYRKAFGARSTIVYPFIDAEKYKVASTRENVTFINPVAHKGCFIALEIARACPEIPFTFVEGLPLADENGAKVKQAIAGLPNVTLLPPQSDMRKVYGKCKILLAPSVWEEAYGRVVTEAQINGLPAIASSRGGLPESVGPGGMLLDIKAPIEDWVRAIRQLWTDETLYADLSAKAMAYAKRPEMTFSYQIDAHEHALLDALKTPVGAI